MENIFEIRINKDALDSAFLEIQLMNNAINAIDAIIILIIFYTTNNKLFIFKTVRTHI